MGCSSCGKVSGCGCGPINASQVILQPVPAGARPCSPLSNTCGTGQPATPAPYYGCSSQCEESHCQEIVYNYYSASICTTYAFNMPACAETVNVYFSGVKVLPVGAYLWNETYGYLEVTAFNNQTGLATLLNHCNEGNAAVGTNVPACTCFVVSDPPQEVPVNPFVPYVAEDFTAPADGDCTTITVTTVAGLVVGGLITIGTGIYVLDEILTPTTIVICNEGDGLPAGTVVEAENEAGQLQYPITLLQSNPCTATNVSEGKVVVCTDGTSKGLSGTNVGDALVLSNATTELGKYVSLGQAAENILGAEEDFTLDAADPDHTSPVITFGIVNSNSLKPMAIHVTISLKFELENMNAPMALTYVISQQIDGGGYVDMKRLNVSYGEIEQLNGTKPFELVAHNVYTLAPLGVVNLQYNGSILGVLGGLDAVDVADFTLQASYIAVAV